MRSFEDVGLGCGSLGSGLVREHVDVSATPERWLYLRQGEAKDGDWIPGGEWTQEERLTGTCPVSHRAELG